MWKAGQGTDCWAMGNPGIRRIAVAEARGWNYRELNCFGVLQRGYSALGCHRQVCVALG